MVVITRLTRDTFPRISLSRLASSVFPKDYALSLVIAGDDLTTQLNTTYRKKHYVPNVLSFPIDAHTGEIFLNLKEARRQYNAGRVEGSWTSFVALLLIHSMLHLKGMQHGRKMEIRETRLLSRLGYRASLIS